MLDVVISGRDEDVSEPVSTSVRLSTDTGVSNSDALISALDLAGAITGLQSLIAARLDLTNGAAHRASICCLCWLLMARFL